MDSIFAIVCTGFYQFFTFRKGIGGNGRFFFALKNGIMNYCKVRDGEEPPFFRAYIIQ